MARTNPKSATRLICISRKHEWALREMTKTLGNGIERGPDSRRCHDIRPPSRWPNRYRGGFFNTRLADKITCKPAQRAGRSLPWRSSQRRIIERRYVSLAIGFHLYAIMHQKLLRYEKFTRCRTLCPCSELSSAHHSVPLGTSDELGAMAKRIAFLSTFRILLRALLELLTGVRP
ncbi:hypothetical protein BKA93DRAFT_209620 [Sparassis latifolia]